MSLTRLDDAKVIQIDDPESKNVKKLTSILNKYNARVKQKRKAIVRNVFFGPPGMVLIASSFLTLILGSITGMEMLRVNAINNKCPDYDFQSKCSDGNIRIAAMGSVSALDNCAKDVDMWCTFNRNMPNNLLSTELAASLSLEFSLLCAIILFYKNCTLKVELEASEVVDIHNINSDVDLSHNPAGKIKQLIKNIEETKGLRENTIFANSNSVNSANAALLPNENREAKGCLDRMYRRLMGR